MHAVISDPQKVFPLAKVALKPRNLKARDGIPFNLLAGLTSGLAGPPILPSGAIDARDKMVALD
ncbi:MAG: hypothetical protein WCE49_11375 [Terrimicrobiaceae bacterium]